MPPTKLLFMLGVKQLALVVISSVAEKSFGPAPAEIMREPERENRSNLRCRAGKRFLGYARNDNEGQLLNSYICDVMLITDAA